MEVVYGNYMIFFGSGGGNWPLFGRAIETPVELIIWRRLYAIETWIAISGMAVS